MTPKYEALKPSPALLCKLGSILVHLEEGLSAQGHPLDVHTFHMLMADPEVTEWLKKMDKLAMIPKKR